MQLLHENLLDLGNLVQSFSNFHVYSSYRSFSFDQSVELYGQTLDCELAFCLKEAYEDGTCGPTDCPRDYDPLGWKNNIPVRQSLSC